MTRRLMIDRVACDRIINTALADNSFLRPPTVTQAVPLLKMEGVLVDRRPYRLVVDRYTGQRDESYGEPLPITDAPPIKRVDFHNSFCGEIISNDRNS